MKKLFSAISLAVCLIVLSGCSFGFYSIQKGLKSYSGWTEENGVMYFRVTDDDFWGYGWVNIDDEKRAAFFDFITYKDLLRITLLDNFFGFDSNTDGEMVSFGLKYKDNVLQAKDVKLFGKVYPSIVLHRSEVDRSELEAWEYPSREWTDEEDRLYFSTSISRIGAGTATIDGRKENISFFWGPNKTFSIYSGHDPVKTDTPLAEGTYTSEETEAVLTFTHNSLWKDVETLAIHASLH